MTSATLHADYVTTGLLSLRAELLRTGSRSELIAAADRAEKLLTELTAAKIYRCDEICRRVYPYFPEAADRSGGEHPSGEALQHDLRRLVEDLTDTADLRADEVGEPVHTIEELSKMWNVSTKTINRWREVGLISRRLVFEGGKRIGFLRSSVERFARLHRGRIGRGSRFRHLSESDRRTILDMVRRLAGSGKSRSRIYLDVARQMNCSIETVRTTVKRHEQRHPESPLFDERDSPLSESVLRRMYAGFRRGASLESLAARYGRSISTIRRIINQRRAQAVAELPLDHIFSQEFVKPGAAASCLAPLPEETRQRAVRAPKDLPAYLTALYDVPLLTHPQEVHLFRKMNYLKWKASQLRDQLDPERPSSRLLDEIEQLFEQAVATKNHIVRANLRLVVSIVRKRITPVQDLFDLISDGNVSLLRAVDKFDYSRGFKFSTYASWAIVKNLARTVPAEYKQSTRFRTSQDELLDAMRDYRCDHHRMEEQQRAREDQVDTMLGQLNERERRIIMRRFGLGENVEPLTLKELGEELGVTKERVRQLQTRAMKKLRSAAEQANLGFSTLD
jgi:RNA polymerase primary sigma factor/RNA polymerase sigma factor